MAAATDIEAVYRRHVGTVFRLCYSFLGSAAEAEDAAQAVFLGLVERPRTFADADHEKAWLIACAQNRCRDVLRSARVSRRGTMPDDVPDERGQSETGDATDAVLRLPEKYKTCVYLHYYEGYKTDEIAAMTGTPASTVRSHLSEARALLRRALGEEAR